MAGQYYELGPFRLDVARRRLSRRSEVIPLTSRVMDTLLVLVQNRGQAISREELMKAVWPDTFVEEGNLTQNISTLRKLLGEGPADHTYIETVPKLGYRFVADVTVRTENTWLSYRRSWLPVAGFLAVLAIAGGAAWLFRPWAKAPASSLAAVPLTSYPGEEWHPSFSPDGNQVAFAWKW